MRRVFIVTASALLAIAVAIPVRAQGKGKGHKSNPPSRSVLPSPTVAAPATAGTGPFAWIDDASVLAPGAVALSISMQRWQGADLSEVEAPVIGIAVGLAKRVQISASIPRVIGSSDPAGAVGGFGTTYVSGKISVLTGTGAHVKLAVAPTIGILGEGTLQSLASDERRTQFGLPVSAEIDRGAARIFASAGVFTQGVRFAGGGLGVQATPHVAVSAAFSLARTTDSTDAMISDRREVSGSVAFSVRPQWSLFGSLGRTIGTSDQDAAGTTLSAGMIVLLTPAPIK